MAFTATNKDFVLRAGILVQGTSTVTTSSGQTNALQVNAGAAISKNLIVGSTADIYGNTFISGNLQVVDKINNLTITPPLTASTLTISSGKVINFPQSLSFPNDSGTSTYLISTDGSGNLSWVAPGSFPSPITIENDTSTNAIYYPVFSSTSTGNITTGIVSTTKLQFNPSTGELAATEINSLSDIALKENINTIENSLTLIEKLDGITFNWKNTGKLSAGVIANQVESILPQLISSMNGYKTVNYNGLIGLLIEAIKSLNEKLSKLENRS